MRDRYAAPRTSLQCVCTRRRNCCIGQLSPSSEYAPQTAPFPARNSATSKLTHYPGNGRLLDLSESPVRVLVLSCRGPADRRQRTTSTRATAGLASTAPRVAGLGPVNRGGQFPALALKDPEYAAVLLIGHADKELGFGATLPQRTTSARSTDLVFVWSMVAPAQKSPPT